MLIFKVNSSLNINVKSGVKGNRIQKKPKVCLKIFFKISSSSTSAAKLDRAGRTAATRPGVQQLDNENTQKNLGFFT